ncbi:unnamed protein product, partial [Ectocarpus fasciculatus]
GHHPWFLQDPYEEEHRVWTPIPRKTRLRWLAKMGHCKVKFIFSGHCHRNYEARVKRPIDVETAPRPTPAAAAAAAATPGGTDENAASGGDPTPHPGNVPELSPPSSSAGGTVDPSSGDGTTVAAAVGQEGSVVVDDDDAASRQVVVDVGGGIGSEDGGGQGEADDAPGSISDDDEDTDTSEAIDMRSIVTSSCGAPLGPDPPGLRVVRVFSRRIEHEYFDIDAPPQGIDLGGEP